MIGEVPMMRYARSAVTAHLQFAPNRHAQQVSKLYLWY